MSIGMEGCGPNQRTYSKDEYDALEAECERLREETAVLLGDIAELEVRRDAALAELAASDQALRESRTNEAEATRMLAEAREELAALKGEQVAVAWRVTGAGGLTVTPQYPSWAEDDSRLLITPLYAHPSDQVADDLTMVKVSRELANIAALHLENSGYTETGKKLRAKLAKSEGVKP